MPTGYTHKVQDGEVTTVRDLALICARAFGALITMRDDPSDAPIPQRIEPNTKYYDLRIAAAREKLDELPTLTPEQCEVRAYEDHKRILKYFDDTAATRAVQRERYETMIAKVEAWAVPAEISELRNFMLSQLRESLSWDCGDSYRSPVPERLSGEEWRASALVDATLDLERATKSRDEEIARTVERNSWLKALHAAL